MKEKLLKLSLPLGLLIFAAYKIISLYVVIEDSIGIPMLLVSVTCMIISCAFSGWCIGKGKSPYNLKKK